jgi:hypothetical protein
LNLQKPTVTVYKRKHSKATSCFTWKINFQLKKLFLMVDLQEEQMRHCFFVCCSASDVIYKTRDNKMKRLGFVVVPPDLFLLGCIFVVVEIERYLDESLPGWKQKIEKHGGNPHDFFSLCAHGDVPWCVRR